MSPVSSQRTITRLAQTKWPVPNWALSLTRTGANSLSVLFLIDLALIVSRAFRSTKSSRLFSSFGLLVTVTFLMNVIGWEILRFCRRANQTMGEYEERVKKEKDPKKRTALLLRSWTVLYAAGVFFFKFVTSVGPPDLKRILEGMIFPLAQLVLVLFWIRHEASIPDLREQEPDPQRIGVFLLLAAHVMSSVTVMLIRSNPDPIAKQVWFQLGVYAPLFLVLAVGPIWLLLSVGLRVSRVTVSKNGP
jgi:hypothetical protein